MEYPEDKVIISRSKLEAMEAELAAYKNKLVDYKSNEIIQQQQEEIERLKNNINELGITLNGLEEEKKSDKKEITNLALVIELQNMKIERMKKNRFRFWKSFE